MGYAEYEKSAIKVLDEAVTGLRNDYSRNTSTTGPKNFPVGNFRPITITCYKLSDLFSGANSSLADGWKVCGDVFGKINDVTWDVIEDLASDLTNYINETFFAEANEATALEQTNEAAEDVLKTLNGIGDGLVSSVGTATSGSSVGSMPLDATKSSAAAAGIAAGAAAIAASAGRVAQTTR